METKTTDATVFPGRAILHVDMDAFYASVEELDDPSLRGKPVMVGGTPDGRGVVAAANYEARKFGVHSAMSAARAIRLCPDGIFLRGRMERYAEISRQVFSIFDDFSPLVEPLSIDEAFLDVTGCKRIFGTAEKVGHLVKDRILAETGLVASVGIASNKFLAKLASDLDKPDGFTVIPPDESVAMLAGLPVGKLWGVGKVAEKELGRFGIRKVRDLLAVPRDLLVSQFGEHTGRLLELAVGHDERPVIPLHEAKSIGNETTFREDIADPDHLQGILDNLSAKVARRLRSHGFLARTVTLKARYPDFTTHTRSETLKVPTDASVEIRDAARHLLARRLERRGRSLRLIGVTASNLVAPGQGQGTLFVDPERARDRKLDDILDRVHGKFGSKLRRGLDSKE
jgi:DNA polymerase-4